MRGEDERSGSLFSYVDLEARVGQSHPLRAIRAIVNEALTALASDFSALYSPMGRPSIAPEKLLRAMLLQAFYSIRSERQLMEQMDYNLLFRWFVGLSVDEPVWVSTVFSKNRDRNAFCRLKDFRRIATRYDRLARNFLASIYLVQRRGL